MSADTSKFTRYLHQIELTVDEGVKAKLSIQSTFSPLLEYLTSSMTTYIIMDVVFQISHNEEPFFTEHFTAIEISTLSILTQS